MKHPRDLEIARVLGWYRIPVQSAPKIVRVDWLAFYLPRVFGEDKWSIRYLARVRGYELVTRKELFHEEKDHLRADEPYFKVQLGPLHELSRPILSNQWRRFTFLYTTGERLMKAKEMKDLQIPASEDRNLLWRMLREREAREFNRKSSLQGGEK
jgi:hypothetical protein